MRYGMMCKLCDGCTCERGREEEGWYRYGSLSDECRKGYEDNREFLEEIVEKQVAILLKVEMVTIYEKTQRDN